MSQATVRTALAEYFATPPIDNVSQVMPAWPTEFTGDQWNLLSGQPYTSLLAINLDNSNESRITMPAYGANKQRNHLVSVLVYYQYMKPDYPDPNEPYNTGWVHGLDQILDDIITRIRTDQTAGTSVASGANPVVFQFGQENNDIIIERDLPIDNGDTIISWNRVDIRLTEIVQA